MRGTSRPTNWEVGRLFTAQDAVHVRSASRTTIRSRLMMTRRRSHLGPAECHRALGLPPCLRHPLIDTFRNSPIDKQAKILCASHTVLAHRDVSRAVVPPLGLLHRRELRDHDSFDRSFTLKELEWSVRGVELDVEPHESTRHIFPICLQLLPIAYTLANIDEIGGHRLLLRFVQLNLFLERLTMLHKRAAQRGFRSLIRKQGVP